MSRVASAIDNGNGAGGSTLSHNGLTLPLLVICRGDMDASVLQPLRDEPRLELLVIEQLTPTWVSFAQRVASGVILIAPADPLGALVYARTAGIDGTILVAVDAKRRRECAELEATGVTCVALPFTAATRKRVVSALDGGRGATSFEPNLRLLFDPIARVVHHRDKTVRLSQREFALLHCLAQHGGRPVSADQILTYVWDGAVSHKSRQIVDVYVCQLRRKLARIGLGNTIRTLRGYGYTLEPGYETAGERPRTLLADDHQ